ncbi:MAG: DNA repair protein RecN [Armatimonadetes bacterium]|nr:DNA repair protein RecN [Armatimonadota bacterium]
MLAEIEIRDFAIVAAARVSFGPGLCVLSGETGAGKSLVVDAVAALLGERTRADLVRSGAEAARLRAVFDTAESPGAVARLEVLGLPPDPDHLCVVAREIRANGRSRCTVNGAAATVAMLRQLGEVLLDIHGQHEHQSLLQVSQHLRILDATGGAELTAARGEWERAYSAWREVVGELARLRVDEAEKARRIDMLRFQTEEIGAARLTPGEYAHLRAERGRLAHAERLLESAARAHQALEEAGEAASALDRVAEAQHAVRQMAAFDATLEALADDLDQAWSTLAEAARTLADYAGRVELDPRRLDQVEERLELIERLRRKFGPDIEAILAFGRQAETELEAVETLDQRVSELEAERDRLHGELAGHAARLTAARRAAAEALRDGVTAHLADLGMAAGRFDVALGGRDEPGPDGMDTVELLFTATPGELLRGLARIASGGEISRVMLALKSQLAAVDDIPTLVFDEIDVGIGGVTIHNVARKLAAIAAGRQVICITHHAPIAARADHHIVVTKDPAGDGTLVTVERVEDEARLHELARMLGRQPPTEATIALARELLAEVSRG